MGKSATFKKNLDAVEKAVLKRGTKIRQPTIAEDKLKTCMAGIESAIIASKDFENQKFSESLMKNLHQARKKLNQKLGGSQKTAILAAIRSGKKVIILDENSAPTTATVED